jgi:toxin CptA
MHSAPSVSYPVGRFVWWAALLLLTLASVVVSALAVSWQAREGAWLVVLVAGAGALSLGVVWRSFQRTPVGFLAWAQGRDVSTPGAWYWRTDGRDEIEAVVELSVILMLKDHMCVSVRVARQPRWTVWLSGASAPPLWHAMRQAVWAARDGLPGKDAHVHSSGAARS